MARTVPFLLAVAALAAAAAASMNPCHGNKNDESAWDCERVHLPSGLCLACPLRPPLADGNFEDCTRIYDLDAPGCKGKFEEYVSLNPCDGRRKELVGRWDNGSKERLDYFAYSICELTCDTVEKGSKLEEYEQRKQETRLWSLGRGNGPAHFVVRSKSLRRSFMWECVNGEAN
jgi:hypothetical protein